MLAAIFFFSIIGGCASNKPAEHKADYSAYKESRPRSILVLPPLNNTAEVQASDIVLSYATRPLAEAGYYVIPVTLVAETFRENGMTQATDMHATRVEKLREIFGADAALYISVNSYGTKYTFIESKTTVSVTANLVDLKTG